MPVPMMPMFMTGSVGIGHSKIALRQGSDVATFAAWTPVPMPSCACSPSWMSCANNALGPQADHGTLRPLTIEETYELGDAILEGDLDGVKKELGDLLLHMVFYAGSAARSRPSTSPTCSMASVTSSSIAIRIYGDDAGEGRGRGEGQLGEDRSWPRKPGRKERRIGSTGEDERARGRATQSCLLVKAIPHQDKGPRRGLRLGRLRQVWGQGARGAELKARWTPVPDKAGRGTGRCALQHRELRAFPSTPTWNTTKFIQASSTWNRRCVPTAASCPTCPSEMDAYWDARQERLTRPTDHPNFASSKGSHRKDHVPRPHHSDLVARPCRSGLAAQCMSPITAFLYLEDFENAAAWTAGGTSSGLGLGRSAHPSINTAGGGMNSWCRRLTGAFTTSARCPGWKAPASTWSGMDHQPVSFQLFWEVERQYDGLGLQVSTDGGLTWTNVGAWATRWIA